MGIDAMLSAGLKTGALLATMIAAVCLAGCGTGPLVGLVYTNVKMPLTRDLDATPLPIHPPHSDRTIEVKEPFSGLGLYARVNSNALGDIATRYGVAPLYFADQEVFSVLGIWKTHRVILYGEVSAGSNSVERGTQEP